MFLFRSKGFYLTRPSLDLPKVRAISKTKGIILVAMPTPHPSRREGRKRGKQNIPDAENAELGIEGMFVSTDKHR